MVHAAPRNRRPWPSYSSAASAAASQCAVALPRAEDGGAGRPTRPRPVALQFGAGDLAYVESKPLSRWLPVSGTLQPVRQAVVKAKVAGDVRQIAVREGETVQAGQMLGPHRHHRPRVAS